VLREYVDYFKYFRPHQGIKQAIPTASKTLADSHQSGRRIVALPILGGLHHNEHVAA
jgi:hypothetical protein